MPTPNLGLATINGSDFVSASVLSQNFEILDKLGYDYVIEQGKSGQWRYRKFKSGIAEAWAKLRSRQRLLADSFKAVLRSRLRSRKSLALAYVAA